MQPGPKKAQRSLLLREMFFAFLDIRLDAITAKLSASWAYFLMLVSKLDGLNHSQSLIHRKGDGKVIHGDLPKNTFIVNDKEAPKRDAFVSL